MAHHLRWASTSKLTLTSTSSSSCGLLSGQYGWRGSTSSTLPSPARTLFTHTPVPVPLLLPSRAPPRGIRSAVGRQAAGSVNKPRLFHTTAARRDHYSTLDISPQASQKDIKAQFYKLSKQFHPDRNQGSDDAKRKFQEVSEAYASLGTEANRKEYDRSLAARRAGGGGGGGRSFRYASSDNSSRRARATYAWNYRQQQGRRDSQQHQSRASSYHPHFSGSSASSGSGSSSSMFERFAARERRREAATQARQGTAAYKDSFGNVSPEEHHAQTASPVIRFLQVAGLFYVVFWVGTRLGGGSQTTKIKAEQEDEWEHRDSVTIRRC